MKLIKFYKEGELSTISMSNVDETITEVKSLFFDEQIIEEQIILEICSENRGRISHVDELRLDFDRIYTKKQLQKKAFLSACKIVDSSTYQKDFSIQTVLNIKAEQRYLNAIFRGYYVLLPRNSFFKKNGEPMLVASLKNDNFYLLNLDKIVEKDAKINSFFNWILKKTFSKMYSKL